MMRPYIDTAALLTQVSMRPNSLNAAAAMASLAAGSATSATTYAARPACRQMPDVAARRSASFRAASTTQAPRLAARLAVTSPIPLDAPVITMTCSSSGLSVGIIMFSSVRVRVPSSVVASLES